MANKNPTWGYTRIRGALKSLDHQVARNTIKAILKGHGIEPTPQDAHGGDRRNPLPTERTLDDADRPEA